MRDHYTDDGSQVLGAIPVEDNGRAVEVALIGTTDDARMIRVSIGGVEGEPSSEERLRFDDLTEAMLALLRIYHDHEIALAQPAFRYGYLNPDGAPPSLNIKLNKTGSTFHFDVGFATAYMRSDKEFQDILRLYADALHPYSPVQYRYLSAFKIIEHDFKQSRHKWKPELDGLLASFEAAYRSLNVSPMSLKSFMIDLRDKCSHIKVGDADRLTIVGIGSPDTERVIRFLPLLLDIVRKHIFDAYKSNGVAFRAT
jgi:hypothetical protein